MEIHNELGKGFSEIVYKDAIEFECKRNKFPYEREKEFLVHYKNVVLPHRYFADFVIFEDVILEVKSCEGIVKQHIGQALNYLAASKLKLELL